MRVTIAYYIVNGDEVRMDVKSEDLGIETYDKNKQYIAKRNMNIGIGPESRRQIDMFRHFKDNDWVQDRVYEIARFIRATENPVDIKFMKKLLIYIIKHEL